MKLINSKFNIFDLNFILCFCGFTIFTTFVDNSIGSIAYRAFALIISLICLSRTGINIRHNIITELFIGIFIIILLKFSVDYIINPVPVMYQKSVINVFLFGYGVTFIPMLSVIGSINKINHRVCLNIIFFALLVILIMGNANNDNFSNVGRANLNNRQSTLAFGDSGAYLVIVSFACISFLKKSRYSFIIGCGLILGIIVGFMAIGKAASRGPLLGCLVAFLYILLHSSKAIKFISSIILTLMGVSIVAVLRYLEEISPILFARVISTIENHDMSGREGIFELGINEIKESPILGTNPVILESNGNFTCYHNCYLDIAVGLGIVGGIVFIIMILSLAFQSWNRKKITNTPWSMFIMGLLWFFIFRSLSGVNILTNTTYDICIVLSASILSCPRNQKYEVIKHSSTNLNIKE